MSIKIANKNNELNQLIGGGLQRSTPEAQGVSSRAIIALLDDIEKQGIEMNSLMILRNGVVIAEGWWAPYQPQYVHDLASLSKSFTATAVGIAVDKKLLSVEDKVLSFFPEYTYLAQDEKWQDMRVKHLLTMSQGHGVDTSDVISDADDWARAFFELPLQNQPGEVFLYDSGASYMLSVIVAKATGIDLFDWLNDQLFTPLGIEEVRSVKCPQGYSRGGWGMDMKTIDVAKLGQLYLNRGMWNGKRVLSEDWVEEATRRHIAVDLDAVTYPGYGYQFWRKPHNTYAAVGANGQYSLVIPDKNMVVAATASTAKDGAFCELLWQHLLPAAQTAELAADAEAQRNLAGRLQQLAIPPCSNSCDLALIDSSINGKRFTFSGEGFMGINAITFSLQADGIVWNIEGQSGNSEIVFGYGKWCTVNTAGQLQAYRNEKDAASAGWTAANQLETSIVVYEVGGQLNMTLIISGAEIELRGSVAGHNFPGSKFTLTGTVAQD